MATQTKRKAYVHGDILLLDVGGDFTDKVVRVVKANFESPRVNYVTVSGAYACVQRRDIVRQLTREEAEQMAQEYINKKQPKLARARNREQILEVRHHEARMNTLSLESDIARGEEVIKMARGEESERQKW